VDRDDDAELPPTTRIGPAAGSGRGLRTALVLLTMALAIAIVKPWDLLAAPAGPPGREGAAIPAVSPPASPPVAALPAAGDWTEIGAQGACLGETGWLAVVDQVDGPTVSRSWTRLDLAPASDPLDPAIARTHVYAEAVPRLGFCAPTGSPDTTGVGGSGDASFRVQVWRLAPGGGASRPPAPGGGASEPPGITEIEPIVVSGGAADRGVLYRPPGGPVRAARDPENVWAVGGSRVPRPAAWSADEDVRGVASWAPGTYVFRVALPGAGPAGSDEAWFAIELRGPWTGPGPSVGPSPSVGPPVAPSVTPSPSGRAGAP